MKKIPLSLILIILLGMFLRLVNADKLFYFFMDEALLAFRGWGLFALQKIFIIGGISPLGFHLPPYFYWLAAVFLPVLNYSPVVWGYVSVILGGLTILAIYFWADKIGGKKLGILASLLYATSFTAIGFDRHFWPLVLNPLFTVVTLFLLIKNYRYQWLWLALVLTLAVTADPTNLTLLILVLIILKTRIYFLLSFVFLFLTPLLVFDLRHQGSNIIGIAKLFTQVSSSGNWWQNLGMVLLLPVRVLSRFWYAPQIDLSTFYTYCERFSLERQLGQPLALQIIAFLVLFFYLSNKIKNRSSKENPIVLLIFIYYFGLFVYGLFFHRPLFDHYLAGLLPVFALITAKFFFRFWVVGFFLTVLFVSFNSLQIFKAENPYGLQATQQAVDWSIAQLKGQDFALDSVSSCFRYSGIRYLYEIKGKAPKISFIDPQFFWLYRDMPGTVFPDKMVVFSDLTNPVFQQPVLEKNTFGAWTVYILDNQKKNYNIEGL